MLINEKSILKIYLDLITKLKELNLEDEWKQLKKDERIECDYPSTLVPRMKKFIKEKDLK